MKKLLFILLTGFSLLFGADKMLNVQFLSGMAGMGGEVELGLGNNMGISLLYTSTTTTSTADYNTTISATNIGTKFYLYSNNSFDGWYIAPLFNYVSAGSDYYMKAGLTGGASWMWDSGFNISWDIGYGAVFGGYITELDNSVAGNSAGEALVGFAKVLLGLESNVRVGWAF